MTQADRQPMELFVWTDIDPEHEEDFNRWYDREHMQERVSIPGFRWARRYRALSGQARRYLALYRVDGRDVFTSDAYREAFKHQTDWSNRNFARMHNTQRRVLGIPFSKGAGTGGTIGLICTGASSMTREAVTAAFAAAGQLNGVIGIRCLEPDPELSTPLPSEDTTNRKLEPYLVLEATSETAAAKAVQAVLDALELSRQQGLVFSLMWELRAEDLD
ncbi:MAG: hypothetical protein K9K64_00305 [Desulfohalobiaceae bacterium]|nr:hypothetical protein [Desulfohalobiaceae bacterium]